MSSYNFGPGLFYMNSDYITIKNSYLHGWDLDSEIETDDAHGGIICNGSSNISVLNNTIENSVKTGTSTKDHQNGIALRSVDGEIGGNTIHDVSSCMLGVTGLIHDNIMYNVRWTPLGDSTGNHSFDDSYHTNLMYVIKSAYVYNNIYYDSVMPTNYYLEACYGGDHDGTIYAFNNIGIAGSKAGAAIFNLDSEAGTAACGTWYIFNNTIEVDDGSGHQTLILTTHPELLKNVYIQNNHVICSNGSFPPSCNKVSGDCVINHNLIQSEAEANSQGYTLENHYAPIATSISTTDVGADLSFYCAGDTEPLCFDRLGVSRSYGNGWDIGSYENNGSPSSPKGFRFSH